MKNRTLLLLCLLPSLLCAQSLDEVWSQIKNNNLTISALERQMQAEKTANHVGIAPDDPEVEVAYLWGDPVAIGNRIDVSATQSFDFPTAYLHRARIANLRDQQAELAYSQQCNEILLQAGELYYGIIYGNTRIRDMERCLSFLSDLAAAQQKKLKAGEVNIFDYNKIKLTELNLRQTMAQVVTERDGLLLELQQLNGGKPLTVTCDRFPELTLPERWEERLDQAPLLRWHDKEQEIAAQQVRLERSLWAPRLSAGYMREQVPTELFQGVKVGVSLPLWHQSNSLKQARLRQSAASMAATDEQLRLRSRLQEDYAAASTLLQQAEEYRQLLETVDSFALLRQALESGQLSIVEYLMETSIYHESHERFAEMQYKAAMRLLALHVLCETTN